MATLKGDKELKTGLVTSQSSHWPSLMLNGGHPQNSNKLASNCLPK